jgi:hypothetical protein
MKIKLQLKRTPDSAPEYYYTNLFVVTEWERLTGRNVQQLSTQPQISDYCCWMYVILKMKGEQIGDNWREWIKSMPDMAIEPVLDETNPNPTDAAPTAAN